jgi:hypothetical protein
VPNPASSVWVPLADPPAPSLLVAITIILGMETAALHVGP